MATDLEASTNFVLHNIRQSGLNYSCQETPYSIYVTLRKSFRKSRTAENQDLRFLQELPCRKSEFELTKIRDEQDMILEAFDHLKHYYDDAIEENARSCEIIENFESVNEEKSAKIESLESAMKDLRKEKDLLEDSLQSKWPTLDNFVPPTILNLETPTTASATSLLGLSSLAPPKLSDPPFMLTSITPIRPFIDHNKNIQIVKTSPTCQTKPQTLTPQPTASSARSPTCCKPFPPSATSPPPCISRAIPPPSPPSSTPATPPPQNDIQLCISFKNFLEGFKNEDREFKYIKSAKEMVAFSGNVLQVTIKDLEKHNQFLSEKVKSDYLGVHSSLNSAFKKFMAENVERSDKRDYYLSFS